MNIFLNCEPSTLRVDIGILDAQHKNAAGLSGKKPLKQRGTDAPDMHKTGGTGRKTCSNLLCHEFSPITSFKLNNDNFVPVLILLIHTHSTISPP
jgi:hypothetical protein